MAEASSRGATCCSWWTWAVLALLVMLVALQVPQALTAWNQGKQSCAARAWTQRHLDMSAAAAEQQELRNAERILEEAIKLDPGSPELRLAHLKVFARRAAEQPQTIGESDLDPLDYALATLEAGPEGGEPAVRVARGRLLLRQGNVADARKELEETVATSPDYAYGYLALADLERAAGRSLEAMASFEKAAAASPENLVALNNLGVQYLELERPEDALKMFEKAVAAKDNAASRVNASDALVRLKRDEEAIAHIQKAAALSPKSPDIRRRLGTMLRQAGRLDEAEKALVEGLNLQADVKTALELGALYLGRKDYKKAGILYAKLLEGNPDLLEAKFGWAESLRGLGRTAQARDAYQSYLGKAQNSTSEPAGRLDAARKGLEWASAVKKEQQ